MLFRSASAKEITALTEDSSSKTARGVQLAKDLQRKLDEIGSSVRKVADLMDEIAKAAAEQATGISQVNQAILQFDQASQRNASMSEETASATEELARLTRELTQLIAFFSPEIQSQEPAPAATRVLRPSNSTSQKRTALEKFPMRAGQKLAMPAPAAKLEVSAGGNDGFKDF